MASCLVDLLQTICGKRSMTGQWTLSLNNGKSICNANLDLAKAFDSVCISKLLCKLQS